MYGRNQFLPHFLMILKPALIFGCVPFTWNRKKGQIETSLTSKWKRTVYRVKCNLHVLLTAVIILQVVFAKTEVATTKALSTFTVAMLTLTTVVVKEYCVKQDEATSLLQRFIHSSTSMKGDMDKYEKRRKLAVDLLNPGTFLFPLFYTLGVTWMSPCLPSNFGYWMLRECSGYQLNWPGVALAIKCALIFANFWIWSFGMHATDLVGSGVVMIGAMHFRCRLLDYRRRMTSVHSDHSKLTFRHALVYREIQILSRHYNQIHQRGILIAIIIAVVSTQSICVYALVKFHHEMYWLIQLFFAMMGVDCFMAIMMLCGTLADCFDTSVQTLRELGRRHGGRDCKWLKRFHRSCQSIKMRFGMTSFMEKLTPLNFENFSLCQSVNLLLVKD